MGCPAFQDREVRGRETTNGDALIVEHRHVELNQLDPGAELRTLILGRPCHGQDCHQGCDFAHHLTPSLVVTLNWRKSE